MSGLWAFTLFHVLLSLADGWTAVFLTAAA